MIGQWKGKVGLEVLEEERKEEEGEEMKEREDGGRGGGREMEQNHVTWRSPTQQGIS